MAREPINVAASVIADVSAGIYRSPAGALKELLSNAFDGGILHSYPAFPFRFEDVF